MAVKLAEVEQSPCFHNPTYLLFITIVHDKNNQSSLKVCSQYDFYMYMCLSLMFITKISMSGNLVSMVTYLKVDKHEESADSGLDTCSMITSSQFSEVRSYSITNEVLSAM